VQPAIVTDLWLLPFLIQIPLNVIVKKKTLHQPEVVLFQETLADELSATKALSTLFSGWAFLGLDARGRSRGLAISWCSRKINPLNSWASNSCLKIEIQVEGLGLILKIINVYGPHTDKIPYWNSLFNKELLKTKNLIIDGDFNFSLGEVKIWGPSTHIDPQTDFFSHLLASKGLIDIAPIKLLPTWRNLRVGEAQVAKRLDHFLITESMSMLPLQSRQWIGSGGDSDHSPVWFSIEGGPQKMASPFNFNST
jgi:exonuclease III